MSLSGLSNHPRGRASTIFFGVGLALSGFLLAGCDISGDFTFSDGYSFTRTGETSTQEDAGEIADSITRINIDNRFGMIKITPAAEGQTANWTWRGRVWSPTTEQADQFAQQLVLDVATEGESQTWTLVMPEPDQDLDGVESNLELIVDAGTTVTVKNKHGDVTVTGIQQPVSVDGSFAKLSFKRLESDLTVTAQHSSVTVEDVGGKVDLKTSFDDMLVVGVAGPAKLKNEHGDIEASVTGDLDCETSFGDATVSSQGSKIKVANQHGDVDVTVASKDFADCQVTSSFGDIQVVLPDGVKPLLKMKTTFGDTTSSVGSDDQSAQKVTVNNEHGDIEVGSK